MSDNKNKSIGNTGMGVGFVSLIMIFAVICLTVLAVLSYQAAGANGILNTKSAEFTREYYAADTAAKEKLMLLDELALTASKGFFEDDFIALCEEEAADVNISRTANGIELSYSVPVNDRLFLKVEAVFTFNSSETKRYSINEWKIVSSLPDETEEPIGVWDGSMFD